MDPCDIFFHSIGPVDSQFLKALVNITTFVEHRIIIFYFQTTPIITEVVDCDASEHTPTDVIPLTQLETDGHIV